MAAMWSPLTPRFLPTCSERAGRSLRERMRIEGLPIAPADSTSTLHSSSTVEPLGWRVGLGPSLSIGAALTR